MGIHILDVCLFVLKLWFQYDDMMRLILLLRYILNLFWDQKKKKVFFFKQQQKATPLEASAQAFGKRGG